MLHTISLDKIHLSGFVFFFFLKADDVEDYEYGMQLNNSESATESDNPGRRKARQINSGKMKIKDNLISYIF